MINVREVLEAIQRADNEEELDRLEKQVSSFKDLFVNVKYREAIDIIIDYIKDNFFKEAQAERRRTTVLIADGSIKRNRLEDALRLITKDDIKSLLDPFKNRNFLLSLLKIISDKSKDKQIEKFYQAYEVLNKNIIINITDLIL